MTRAIILGAPRSGSGKTTLTLGILRALRRRGVVVRAAKSGPDYIDPAFHEAACGAPSLNLDSWAMAPSLIDDLVCQAAAGSDMLLIESAMGLFDGADGPAGRTGASADLAARLNIPVLLAMDVSGHSQSAAAVLHGFATLNPAVRVTATVANRVASDRHLRGLTRAIEPLGIPFIGALHRDTSLILPERHLGLVQAGEHADLDERLNHLADAVEAQLDLDLLLRCAEDIDIAAPATPIQPLTPPGQRIALASDVAFSFVYPHLMQSWRRAGAEMVPFSPLADEPPPGSCDSCWLPGGYPELHAGALGAAETFRNGLAQFAETRPVHGECGGYVALGKTLTDADGKEHRMAGLLSHATSFAKRKLNLGYRRAELLTDTPIAARDTALRGHEYHYAVVVDPGDDDPVARLTDGWGTDLGPSGGKRGNVSGTFFHAIAADRD